MAALSQVEVDEFLDFSLGDNFKILPDLLKQLNKDKLKLSNQVIYFTRHVFIVFTDYILFSLQDKKKKEKMKTETVGRLYHVTQGELYQS